MITLEQIKKLVPQRIFARGKEYYETDAVLDLDENSPGEWTATVEGTENYSVEVSLDGDDEVVSWYCDCPYDGDMCKHVVATLLAIRDRMGNKKDAFPLKRIRVEEDVTEEVQKLVDASQNQVNIQQLISFANPQELSQFVCDYASAHSDFKAALLNRFLARELSAKGKGYKAEVEKAFTTSSRKSSRYARRYADDWDRDWETIFSRLDALLGKAVLFLEMGCVAHAIAIALQTLRSIGENYDDELMYNDDLYVSDYCERAGDLLMAAAKHPATTQAQKLEMLQELKQIARIDVYRSYDIYELEELMMQINLQAQPADKALELIDSLLEERKDAYDLYQIVLRKVEMLQKLHEEEKAADTLRQYLYLPEIRKREVDKLVVSCQYEEALRLLDEGIAIAEEQERFGLLDDWRKTKLEIYEATHRVPEAIDTCRLLFISGRGRMEYYDKLKKMVPQTQWKDFLEAMMKETNFADFVFGKSYEADIYVKEKDNERLYGWLTSVGYGQLQALMKYSHHLKNTHSELLVPLYITLLNDYAERNLGRNHYELVAQALSCMQKLNGGRDAVQWLVSEYRMKYKRRPAMMEVLNRQFSN